jgi:hypothetical protein
MSEIAEILLNYAALYRAAESKFDHNGSIITLRNRNETF